MRVEISKRHKDSYMNLIREANSLARKFKARDYKKAKNYETLILYLIKVCNPSKHTEKEFKTIGLLCYSKKKIEENHKNEIK